MEDAWQAQNLALMRDAHIRATALPRDLVEAKSRARSACETIWRTARPESNFPAVRPALEEVFRLTREAAGILGQTLGLSPYDGLMTQYQHGIAAGDWRPFSPITNFSANRIARGGGTPTPRPQRGPPRRPL